ncbi:aminotransferase class IV [Stygiobacter electus]|uniref:Aminotransferase class IV n=1 Tax=Stygiobacter electus TaxID=3032292 RepID=A0AAE3TDL1_9BACT|nr:aminotransferase class IV [Stygiobacter electus]MDF1611343.1 aminotransferase class IV [Stygiobacter electus]
MSQLFETIKLQNKKLFNIEYHNERMNNSRRNLFGTEDKINLEEVIKIPDGISNNVFKCRVVYSEKITDIEFQPYYEKKVNSLQAINVDWIDYSYKYLDRSNLQKLLCKCIADDVLIIKNGFVADTTYSNVVFYDGKNYFTPNTPLLKGTKREKLLREGIIKETEIKISDINNYQSLFLINAMLDIDKAKAIPTNKIITNG